MVDRTVSVKLDLDIASYLANLRLAKAGTKDFADQNRNQIRDLGKSNTDLTSAIRGVGKESESTAKKIVTDNESVSKSYRGTRLWVAGLTAALSNLPAIVAPALGLLMAVPGALAVAGVSAGVTAVAVRGVGDAFAALSKGDFDKIAKEMNELAPSARSFVMEVRNLRGEWNLLARSTQDAFFAQLNGQLTQLTSRTMPMLMSSLPRVSAAVWDVVKGVSDWATCSTGSRRSCWQRRPAAS